MSTSMNVAISPELKSSVDRQIAEGQYASSSEYVRDLIRQDQRRNSEQRLVALVSDGLESPEEPPADPAFWRRRREVLREAISQKRR